MLLGPVADALMQQSVLGKIARGDWLRRKPDRPAEGDRLRHKPAGATIRSHGVRAIRRKMRRLRRSRHRSVHGAITKSDSRGASSTRSPEESKRIEASEGKADTARRRYNEFREEHGISGLSTEQQSMVESAAKLRADSELALSGDPRPRGRGAQSRSAAREHAEDQRHGRRRSSPERTTYDRLRQELVSATSLALAGSPSGSGASATGRTTARVSLRSGSGSELPVATGCSASTRRIKSSMASCEMRKSKLAALRERQRGLSEMARQSTESGGGILWHRG